MKPIRLALAACLIGLAGLLTGCLTEVEEFLTDKAQAKADARLLGVWVWSERNEAIYVQVRRAADNPNLMELTYMSVKPAATPPVDEWRRYAAWPTRLGAIDYLNLELIDGNEKKNRRLVMRYEIDPKNPAKLTFWAMSDDAVRAAIKRNDLAGRDDGENYDKHAVITTNRGQLRDYLRANAARIFPEQGATLTRAAVPAE